MRLILIDKVHGRSRMIAFGRRSLAFLTAGLVGFSLLGGAVVGDLWTQWRGGDYLHREIAEQARSVAGLRAEAERRLQSLGATAAELEARLVRLDAMGRRLTDLAGLDDGEFDFSQTPGLGGPANTTDSPPPPADELAAEMDGLEARIVDRERQLELLESLLANRQLQEEVYLEGRPIEKGWISSPFGWRKDPFSGRSSLHQGIDFASRPGTAIVAVASGVVTWSDVDKGYGKMIEISHGGGYSTRYAHNQENLVKAGDLVRKGQVIAHLGSSGRSTGPHVHFEVYKHGKPVDPATYVRRDHR